MVTIEPTRHQRVCEDVGAVRTSPKQFPQALVTRVASQAGEFEDTIDPALIPATVEP